MIAVIRNNVLTVSTRIAFAWNGDCELRDFGHELQHVDGQDPPRFEKPLAAREPANVDRVSSVQIDDGFLGKEKFKFCIGVAAYVGHVALRRRREAGKKIGPPLCSS